MRLAPLALGLAALVAPHRPAVALQSAALARAQQAFDALDFRTAIVEARLALRDDLGVDGQIVAYELLGFAYGAMDSTREATNAFKQLVFLAPDREPDPFMVSPRITSLYASALGQVLVLRHVRLDSASFIADSGAALLRFEVSRSADVVVRAVGEGFTVVVDSQTVASRGQVAWRALAADGTPLPPGSYQLVLDAAEGASEYSTWLDAVLTHGQVDTLPHVVSLPGFREEPEFEQPPRLWAPLGRATFYTALVSFPALLMESAFNVGAEREVFVVSGSVLVAGVIASLKKPEPRPVRSAILYNQLLRVRIAEQNAAIAATNAARRRMVRLGVFAASGSAP